MRRAQLGRAVALGLVASAAVGAVVAAPAQADCVEVHLEVRYEDGTTWYPLEEPHRCMVQTEWERMVELGVEHRAHDPEDGTPNYVWLHVWVPVP